MSLQKTILTALLLSSSGLLPVGAQERVEAVLDWSRRVVLSLPVAGVVENVNARPGQIVAAGDELAHLDARSFMLAIAKAQAEQEALAPALHAAERALERVRELHERGAEGSDVLQQADAEHTRLEALYRAAQANLERAQLERDYSVLRAPFAGVVVERYAVVGSIVSLYQNEPLVVLADDRRLLAKAMLGPAQLDSLRLGEELTVLLDEVPISGVIEAISPEPVMEGDMGPLYGIEVLFDAPRPGIRAGVPVLIELPSAQ